MKNKTIKIWFFSNLVGEGGIEQKVGRLKGIAQRAKGIAQKEEDRGYKEGGKEGEKMD